MSLNQLSEVKVSGGHLLHYIGYQDSPATTRTSVKRLVRLP